jgi:site-specific recombinase XerD
MHQQYDSAVRIVLDFLDKNGMSRTVRKYFRHDVRVLKEYLERKELEYSFPVAQVRLAAAKTALTRIAYLSFRRSIALIEEAVRHGEVRTWHFDYKGGRTQCRVQDCNRRLLDEYLARRAREGCQPSTLQMDSIACTRFLLFLLSHGIDDPASVTPEIIKTYHVQAKHRTHEGKNAYTYRIRGFVRFLAERGLVPETLERSFTTEKASRVRIVSILSASQVAAIRSHSAQSSSPSELRSAAMAALALRMGLRSIDICGLRLSDISWEAAKISIVQRKTGTPLTLPLPVEVGNALARYIIEGRPPCDIANIFITLKRPYTATTRSQCYRSSVAIFGEKKSAADIRGLHVARRTFASGLLSAGIPVSMISRTLGHSDPSSVDEYLATDVKRMRQCAIGLAGIGPRGALV